MRSISRAISGSFPLPEERPRLRAFATVRWGLLVAALVLGGIGVAMVHSASAELGIDFLPRQALWVSVGICLVAVAFMIDYRHLMRFALPVYLAALAALVLVLFVGQEHGGARSWLGIGGLGGQPSELAKLATALFLARYLAGINQPYLNLRQIAASVGIVALPMLLVVLERDLGGAAMFLPILAGMLLVAGVRWRVLVAGALAFALAAGLIWTFAMLDYQRQRIRTFVAPGADPLGAGYQVRQSQIAVGSGGLGGKGYMQGTQSQLRFLPARHTDFIFAVLAEEMGFLGVATTLGLYAVYVSNAARVATRARDRAGVLLVTGLLSPFAFHVLYNTAMVVGLVPITGIPLPFLSYGGSFTLTNFAAAGVILGVDFRRYVNR